MTLRKRLERVRDELAERNGRTDHDTYDPEAIENFERGFDAAAALLLPVVEQASESVDWLCDHVGAHPKPGERHWCAECHAWVHPRDVGLRDRVHAKLSALESVVGEGRG